MLKIKNEAQKPIAIDMHVIEPVEHILHRLPSTRYYGSKKKLLNWIFDQVKGLDYTTVLDVFGGTASVSRLFQAMRKQVTFHDALNFNTDIARAVLSCEPLPSRAVFDHFLENIVPCEGVVSRNFRGVFFKDDENKWIDGCVEYLGNLSDIQDSAYIKYCLYQACLQKRPFNLFHRANLYLRTNASVDRSFGNYATWEKSFELLMGKAFSELEGNIVHNVKPANILNPSDALSLDAEYDLVYLDPPYIHQEERYNIDGYWKRYHFLEGISNYDEWEKKLVNSSKVKMMKEPEHFIEWSRKKYFEDKLFSLIDKHSRSIVVLSYVDGAVPSVDRIKSFFEDKFKNVSLHSAAYSHALSKKEKREVLFVGVP